MIELDKIHLGDCLEGMKLIEDGTVDLVASDPPYLVAYHTNRRKDKEHKFTTEIANDSNEKFIYDLLAEYYRVLKDDSAAYIFCSARTIPTFMDAAEKAGFTWKNTLIWRKNNGTVGDLVAQYQPYYEPCLYLNKGRCPLRNGRQPDVWDFRKVATEQLEHQNQKPLNVMEKCIINSSDRGDIVLDGCMGSGTTALAALNNGRHFIGFEIDPEYHAVACRRIAKFNQNPSLGFDFD